MPFLKKDFLTTLVFLVDLLTNVKDLNQSLQKKGNNNCLVYKKIQDFRDKCRLLKGLVYRNMCISELLKNRRKTTNAMR